MEKFNYEIYRIPLYFDGCLLHLQQLFCAENPPQRQLLMIHGVTYSSHSFDVDVGDYSLSRFLAKSGIVGWTLDIAGFGRSTKVSDGFLPNTRYAAGCIIAAAEAILALTQRPALSLLGWSWGTVTAARAATLRPDLFDKLVLYAPIIHGIGGPAVTEPFHINTREHAAEDFQKKEGLIDPDITEPEVVESFLSSCRRYDGTSSPNGGRRDICVPSSVRLIDTDALTMPTLVLAGDHDSYVDLPALREAAAALPNGSRLVEFPGAGHAMMMEKPFYRAMRQTLVDFVTAGTSASAR